MASEVLLRTLAGLNGSLIIIVVDTITLTDVAAGAVTFWGSTETASRVVHQHENGIRQDGWELSSENG